MLSRVRISRKGTITPLVHRRDGRGSFHSQIRPVGVRHHARACSSVGLSRRSGASAGRIRGKIKESVARPAIAYLAEHAPDWLSKITVQEGTRVRRRFWQPGGGCDRNGIEIATVHAMIDYIHANPVRRGLVERPTDWEWSSARWYAGVTPVAIEMDRTLPPRTIIGPDNTMGGTP